MSPSGPLLEVNGLTVEYRLDRKTRVQAVFEVDFKIEKGETLGLVGESGCGKTSVARAIMQLPPPTSGRVIFKGEDLTQVSPKRLRQLRPQFQLILQNSMSSFNPRRKVGNSIAMPLKVGLPDRVTKDQQNRRVSEIMTMVGLNPAGRDRLPYQFSGGQCQRLQIARALIAKPELLICDEPVSSLDVSVQAQIINLLEDMRERYGLTMLFISHDLSVIKNVCDRAAVMYSGKICEIASTESLYQRCWHPYTRALLNALPPPDPTFPPPQATLSSGERPSPTAPPPGCRFHTRCPEAFALCAHMVPPLLEINKGHYAACHLNKMRFGEKQ